ncbi:hypothetical protein VM1G_00329 [Cytospora mali]|uniref:F-box domain-containing protein n=1 Tax=Cytospora mali TaxID=578113 RepID=A0A194VNE9_CYTMA|nr:hypothetical protein VM1G_00329 [Valsa mali]
MVNLRSKLHLARQGRKSSLSNPPCLDKCDAAVLTQPVGSSPEPEPADTPSSSHPRPKLEALPEAPLRRVASFCDFNDVLSLRRTCRALNRIFETLSFFDMDPPTTGAPSRDALIGMIKTQLEEDERTQDARRDAFLCLAVTVPRPQRARAKAAMGPLLMRARIRGSGRDSPPEDADEHHRHNDDLSLAAEVEAKIGVLTTLLVLGYSDVCDVDMGRQLMAINAWMVKANIWSEKKLLGNKQLNLQLAYAMAVGLIHPWNWSNIPAETPEYQSLAQRVRADFHGEDFTSSNQSFWLSWEGLHTRSLQLAGLIAYILKVGGFDDTPRSDLLPMLHDLSASSGSSSIPPAQLPKLRIPLLEKVGDEGTRVWSNSWQEWYTSRVRDLVANIEDEEWYGYYVYTLMNTENLNPIGSKDPAMENIHFKLGRTKSQSTQRLSLEAKGGMDGVTKEFDFVGTVTLNTGLITLKKNYIGAHYWDYEGVMTPLGIVGEWGKEGTGFNGYFWLWKRSWMDGAGRGETYAYS